MNYGKAFPTTQNAKIYDGMLPLYLTIINSNGSCTSNDANNECHFISTNR